jgi:hypothetical protein
MNLLAIILGSKCDRKCMGVEERGKMWTNKLNRITHWREAKSYIEELISGRKYRKQNG